MFVLGRQVFQQCIHNASDFNPNAHIETAPGYVDHSTAGALYAEQQLGERGRVVAYLIAGYHAGWPNYNTADTSRAVLKSRLKPLCRCTVCSTQGGDKLGRVSTSWLPPDLSSLSIRLPVRRSL